MGFQWYSLKFYTKYRTHSLKGCILYFFRSPWYTRDDFMFLYRFVCRHRRTHLRRPQSFVHAINFEQLFRFLSFWHAYWPCPIDDLIRFSSIFVVTLTLNIQGQIWNLLYLSQKWSCCRETESKHIDWTIDLKCDHGFDLGYDLDIDFSR